MAKQPLYTEADKAAYWNRQADLYQGYANRATKPDTIRECCDRASEAREKAQQYLSPAPSGVQTAANPL